MAASAGLWAIQRAHLPMGDRCFRLWQTVGTGLALLVAFFPGAVQALPLQPQSFERLPPGLLRDEQLWPSLGRSGDRAMLLQAIDHSLSYLNTPKAALTYRRYPHSAIRLERVRRSLERFRELVVSATSVAELETALQREFVLYRSIGRDGQGQVYFTGYFEPVYAASHIPTPEYRYPLFRRPLNLTEWPKPHPTRLQLEGADGMTPNPAFLKGLELVWLRDRFQAFLVHVQGSATLQLTDGRTMTVGFAGKTDQPYVGVGRELVRDGKLALADLTLSTLIRYFQMNPAAMNEYLPRNRSFIFFQETNGAPPMGSINVPVLPERSIATDKTLMPPGAIALIRTTIPFRNAAGQLESRLVSRYVLDQDTGSAIRGAGRVDIFMGSGPEAGERAGVINASGELYYLLLKEAP